MGVLAAALIILLTMGPVLINYRARSLRIEQTNRLRTLGLAVRTLFTDHPEVTLTNLNQLAGSGLKPKDLIDPVNGKPFTLVGPIDEEILQCPSTIVIYGAAATANGVRNATLADGSVQGLSVVRFSEQMKARADMPNKWQRKLMRPESGQN